MVVMTVAVLLLVSTTWCYLFSGKRYLPEGYIFESPPPYFSSPSEGYDLHGLLVASTRGRVYLFGGTRRVRFEFDYLMETSSTPHNPGCTLQLAKPQLRFFDVYSTDWRAPNSDMEDVKWSGFTDALPIRPTFITAAFEFTGDGDDIVHEACYWIFGSVLSLVTFAAGAAGPLAAAFATSAAKEAASVLAKLSLQTLGVYDFHIDRNAPVALYGGSEMTLNGFSGMFGLEPTWIRDAVVGADIRYSYGSSIRDWDNSNPKIDDGGYQDNILGIFSDVCTPDRYRPKFFHPYGAVCGSEIGYTIPSRAIGEYDHVKETPEMIQNSVNLGLAFRRESIPTMADRNTIPWIVSPGARAYGFMGALEESEGILRVFGGYGVSVCSRGVSINVPVLQTPCVGFLNDIWDYDTVKEEWNPRIVTYQSEDKNQLAVVSEMHNVWDSPGTYGPGGRSNFATWIVGDDMYIFGGKGWRSQDVGVRVMPPRMWHFIDEGARWESVDVGTNWGFTTFSPATIDPYAWKVRQGNSLYLYVYGGAKRRSSGFGNSGRREYLLSKGNWIEDDDYRDMTDEEIWEGLEFGFHLYRYYVSGNGWESLDESLVDLPKTFGGVVVPVSNPNDGDRILMFSGLFAPYERPDKYFRDTMYELVVDEFQHVSAKVLREDCYPGERVFASAVSVDQSLFLFGGQYRKSVHKGERFPIARRYTAEFVRGLTVPCLSGGGVGPLGGCVRGYCDDGFVAGTGRECNGHGTCSREAPECVCEDGYSGVYCEEWMCANGKSVNDKESCAGSGRCPASGATCRCLWGRYGASCEFSRPLHHFSPLFALGEETMERSPLVDSPPFHPGGRRGHAMAVFAGKNEIAMFGGEFTARLWSYDTETFVWSILSEPRFPGYWGQLDPDVPYWTICGFPGISWYHTLTSLSSGRVLLFGGLGYSRPVDFQLGYDYSPDETPSVGFLSTVWESFPPRYRHGRPWKCKWGYRFTFGLDEGTHWKDLPDVTTRHGNEYFSLRIPGGRYGHSAWTHTVIRPWYPDEEYFYVFGGRCVDHLECDSTVMWKTSTRVSVFEASRVPSVTEWSFDETLGDHPPPATYRYSWHGDSFGGTRLFYVFGGSTSDLVYYNCLHSYDPETVTWTEIFADTTPSAPETETYPYRPGGRSRGVVFAGADSVLIVMGYGYPNDADVVGSLHDVWKVDYLEEDAGNIFTPLVVTLDRREWGSEYIGSRFSAADAPDSDFLPSPRAGVAGAVLVTGTQRFGYVFGGAGSGVTDGLVWKMEMKCRQMGHFGEKCDRFRCQNGRLNTDEDVCSGHGVCSFPNSPCDCDSGYSGDFCELFVCEDGIRNDQGACSGHGTCNEYKGVCECLRLWEGQFCSGQPQLLEFTYQPTAGTNPDWEVEKRGFAEYTTAPFRPGGRRRAGFVYSAQLDEYVLSGGYGRDENGSPGLMLDLWMWNPHTSVWRYAWWRITPEPEGQVDPLCSWPGARAAHVLLDMWNIVLFGGWGVSPGSETGYLNDIWVYDPNAARDCEAWSLRTRVQSAENVDLPDSYDPNDPQNNHPSGRRGAAIWFVSGMLLCSFGEDSSGLADNERLWYYDLGAPPEWDVSWEIWSAPEDPFLECAGQIHHPFPPRLVWASSWHLASGALFLYGGIDSTGQVHSGIYHYDLVGCGFWEAAYSETSYATEIPLTPGARAEAGVVFFDDWVVGGHPYFLLLGGYGYPFSHRLVEGGDPNDPNLETVGELADIWMYRGFTRPWFGPQWSFKSQTVTGTEWSPDCPSVVSETARTNHFGGRRPHVAVGGMNGRQVVVFGGSDYGDVWTLTIPCELGSSDVAGFCQKHLCGSELEGCSGHGRCTVEGGPCICDAGYLAPECMEFVCADGNLASDAESVCSGHGGCTFPNAPCACSWGWRGTFCSEAWSTEEFAPHSVFGGGDRRSTESEPSLEARSHHGLTVHQEKGTVWLFGGLSGSSSEMSGDLWSFDVSEETWLLHMESAGAGVLGPNPSPGNRIDPAFFHLPTSDCLLLHGGNGYPVGLAEEVASGHLQDTWKFCFDHSHWEFLSVAPGSESWVDVIESSTGSLNYPAAAEGRSFWVVEDSLYSYGGRLNGSEIGLHSPPRNHTWVFSPSTGWDLLESSSSESDLPLAAYGRTTWSSPTGLDTFLFLFGGNHATVPNVKLNTLHRYSVNSNLWKAVMIPPTLGDNLETQPLYPRSRAYAVAAVATPASGFVAYLFGGSSSEGVMGDIWMVTQVGDSPFVPVYLSTSGEEFQPNFAGNGTFLSARSHHRVVSLGRSLLIHGGIDVSGDPLRDLVLWGPSCSVGRSGANCSIFVCADGQMNNGSSVCGGHGTCTVPGGACECVSGYYGFACDEWDCEDGLPRSVSCSGHGSCESSGDACACDYPYRGPSCDEVPEDLLWMAAFSSPSAVSSLQQQHLEGEEMPVARSQYAIAHGGTARGVWMFGGYSLAGFHGDLWRFVAGTWFSASILKDTTTSFVGSLGVIPFPGSRKEHAMIALETSNLLRLFGGCGYPVKKNHSAVSLFGFLNDVWDFDIDTLSWSNTTSSPSGVEMWLDASDSLTNPAYPCGRAGASVWAVGSQMVVFGGRCFGELADPSIVWLFTDEEEGNWTAIQQLPESEDLPAPAWGRTHWKRILSNDVFLYVFGGRGLNSTLFNTVHRFSMVQENWETVVSPQSEFSETNIAPYYPGARSHTAVVVIDDVLAILVGGTGFGPKNSSTFGALADAWGLWFDPDSLSESFELFSMDLGISIGRGGSLVGRAKSEDVLLFGSNLLQNWLFSRPCLKGFSGTKCEYFVCADGQLSIDAASVCSGRGICLEPLGVCKCDDPTKYSNQTHCESLHSCGGVPCDSPNVCSGHGNCTDQGCVCEKVYEGPLCEFPKCVACDRGTCVAPQVCHCHEGYTGPTCNQIVVLSQNISSTNQGGLSVGGTIAVSSLLGVAILVVLALGIVIIVLVVCTQRGLLSKKEMPAAGDRAQVVVDETPPSSDVEYVYEDQEMEEEVIVEVGKTTTESGDEVDTLCVLLTPGVSDCGEDRVQELIEDFCPGSPRVIVDFVEEIFENDD